MCRKNPVPPAAGLAGLRPSLCVCCTGRTFPVPVLRLPESSKKDAKWLCKHAFSSASWKEGQPRPGCSLIVFSLLFQRRRRRRRGWKFCFLQGNYLRGGSQRSNGSLCQMLANGNLGHVRKFQHAGDGCPVNVDLARGLSGTGLFYLLDWLPTSARGQTAFEKTWLFL